MRSIAERLRSAAILLGAFCAAFGIGVGDAAAQADCGLEAPCEVAGGSYHMAPPEGWDGVTPLPVAVFFHGHRSSGRSAMRGSFRSEFGGAGYLVVAPNGAMRAGAQIRAWPARPSPEPARDDIAFTLNVIDDVAKRLPIDSDRILVSGFSAGGSMAWMIACYAGPRFAGYVSVSGALRRPVPDDACPGGPVRLLQIHGFSDTTVPLEGRGIRDWHQGDVFESLDLLRRTNGCRSNPDQIEIGEKYRRRLWTSCASGQDIEMLMHDGGHGLPKGWAQAALAWFERPAQPE